jgi:hypothetical protein
MSMHGFPEYPKTTSEEQERILAESAEQARQRHEAHLAQRRQWREREKAQAAPKEEEPVPPEGGGWQRLGNGWVRAVKTIEPGPPTNPPAE